MPLFAVLVWSLALVGISAWVWTEQTHRPDAQTEAISIRVQQGVGAGGSIKGSQITIATPPVNPTTSGFTAGTGIAVQGGVGAGADIENNRIDITPSGTPSGRSGGPQGQ